MRIAVKKLNKRDLVLMVFKEISKAKDKEFLRLIKM